MREQTTKAQVKEKKIQPLLSFFNVTSLHRYFAIGISVTGVNDFSTPGSSYRLNLIIMPHVYILFSS